MRICLACRRPYEIMDDGCAACGKKIPKKLGIAHYSPAPPQGVGEGGFKESHFADLAAHEAGNFWFRTRNRLILWALGAYCHGFGSLLEIGCGTGFVLTGIAAKFPAARLYGSEVYSAGLSIAMGRLPTAEFMQMDARAIPYGEEFDVVGAFDVLEHIVEDVVALEQIHAALRPGGALILSVPQHDWLWSPLDDSACHVRRYEKADLHAKIESAGFEIVRSTSFVFGLLPFMVLSRFVARHRRPGRSDPLPEIQIHPWLDRIFGWAMDFEVFLIRAGMSLPVGGSRLLVVRKISSSARPPIPSRDSA